LAGIQEILTILLILMAIIILPRIMNSRKTATQITRKKIRLTGRIRMGIVLSIIVPVTAALLLKPWQHNMVSFIATGIIPVAAGWAVFWIFSGFKQSDTH